MALIALTLTLNTFAQNQSTLPKKLEKKVDKIFEDGGWKMPNTPGISFAILQDGKVAYKKSFGASDIENNVPITSKTRFNLARTSAYFTSYAILKLITENKTTLDEDVRKHIKELNNFSHKVSIRDLLNGSSGIYDFYVLMSINGWNPTDNFSQKDVLTLVSFQKQAAFVPGTDYSLSGTNFVLLAELISKISGKSYKQYMEENIFTPIGMKDTFVRTKANRIYNNVAKAYRTIDKEIVANDSKNEILGANNIFSSIEDMILWEKHLSTSEGQHKKIIQLMDTKAQLDNGRINNTNYGNLTLGQLYGHKERGVFSTYIVGSSGGHDSSIFKFPNQKYVAIALSNDGNGYNGYTGVIAAHRILETHFTEPETVDFSKIQTKKLSINKLQKFEGQYWDPLGELSREIKVINDTLRYVRNSNNASALIPLSENRFQMKVQYDDKIYILFPKDKPDAMIFEYAGAEQIPFEKYIPKVFSDDELANNFNGYYINKECNITFSVKTRDKALILTNSKVGDIKYSPIKSNVFLGDKWFMQSIEFKKNQSGKVIGFYVKNNAIRNLWFERVNLNSVLKKASM
ncbi:hypothetical protein GCM10022259_04890 [Aquimarina mytili]